MRQIRDGYFEYECTKCGKTTTNRYCEPIRSRMLADRLCFSCDFWNEFREKNLDRRDQLTIIDGHVYVPGNDTVGRWRGMAGRRFDIEYLEGSAFAGKRITTFDLWSSPGKLPESFKKDFPDTARFLNGAEKAQVGETTCWNPSDSGPEPYPLPETYGIR